MENLMAVVGRLDELQASSVGRRARGSEREPDNMDVHVDTIQSVMPTGDGLWPLPRHMRWRFP